MYSSRSLYTYIVCINQEDVLTRLAEVYNCDCMYYTDGCTVEPLYKGHIARDQSFCPL